MLTHCTLSALARAHLLAVGGRVLNPSLQIKEPSKQGVVRQQGGVSVSGGRLSELPASGSAGGVFLTTKSFFCRGCTTTRTRPWASGGFSRCALHPEISTLHPELQILHPELQTLDPKLQTLHPKFSTLNPKLQTLNLDLHTLNPEPETPQPNP